MVRRLRVIGKQAAELVRPWAGLALGTLIWIKDLTEQVGNGGGERDPGLMERSCRKARGLGVEGEKGTHDPS